MTPVIVVTGLGLVTALGKSVAETWERVVRGDRAFSELSLFSADDYRVRLVAEVPGMRADDKEGDVSRTSELAVHAAREALTSAGLAFPRSFGPPQASGDGGPARIGLVVGGTTAGMLETELLLGCGFRPSGEVDLAVGDVEWRRMLSHPLSAPTTRLARELGPFSRVRSLSSACSSGANAILVGATWLELGVVDAVLCGAADALCRITLSGFNALGALDPTGAKPFDRGRRGLTLGEGAGFVVLERASGARARGKSAICTLLGWSTAAEAHHITNPEPSGRAPARAMHAALVRAGVMPASVDYVNAHGTGTPLNDLMEARALAHVFGASVAHIPVSSQKGQFGHTLAASGAIEAAITAMAVANGIVPPTGGLEDPDTECPLRHVREAEARVVNVAVSSSFGFGGMDAVLVFGRASVTGGAMQVRPWRPRGRPVVITGAAAITPAGTFSGAAIAELSTHACQAESIALDVDASLDARRARRLDRVSRLAALVCSHALGSGASDAGVVFGNAYGAVDATAAYMRRLREKGARFVSPSDFPNLVPSSPAGHVSIYLGLTGPTLVVADLAVSGECAFTQAWEMIATGVCDRVASVAVEEKSILVDHVLGVIFGSARADSEAGKRPTRREGAGAVALAAEDVALQRKLPILARVEQVIAWWNDDAPPSEIAPPSSTEGTRAAVILASGNPELEAILERGGWASCRRIPCAESVGSHEAAGGLAIAMAVGTLAADASLNSVLCLGSSRGSGYAITIGRYRPTAASRVGVARQP